MRLFCLLVLPLLAHADTSVPPNTRSRNSCVSKGSWTPSSGQIDAMEAKLVRFLESQRKKMQYGPGQLEDYLRNYTGAIRAKENVIEVYAWNRQWTKNGDPCSPPLVADGGCGVWRVTFDPRTGEFTQFSCNGEA